MFITKINKSLSVEPFSILFRTASSFKLVEKWKSKLEKENVPEIESSITSILSHVTNTKPTIRDISGIKMSNQQLSEFEKLCECRIARMPLQYIIGEWDFRDLTLKMKPPVFIPRPETEELVELILQQFDSKSSMRFMEIGCGSGAICLSLLKSLPKATCTAIDRSNLACELTRENAEIHECLDRLKIIHHKLTLNSKIENLNGSLDLIVSNPPYILRKQLMELEPEITLYEDLRALDGGEDGLDIVKPILLLSSKKLRKGGVLWLEIDPSHPKTIEKYLIDFHSDLKFVASYKDIFQKERFVEILKL